MHDENLHRISSDSASAKKFLENPEIKRKFDKETNQMKDTVNVINVTKNPIKNKKEDFSKVKNSERERE